MPSQTNHGAAMSVAMMSVALLISSSGSLHQLPKPNPRKAPIPPVSVPLLLGDSAAIAGFSLSLSSFKAFTLAYSDLTSPDFDLAADIASFDLVAVMSFVSVQQFSAASLVAGWILGGALCSPSCREDWLGRDERGKVIALLRGWLVAAPLACAFKYLTLSQMELPSLGRSAEALQLEAQLSGFNFGNVCGDTLGLLGVLLLWRQLYMRNPDMLP